MSLPTLTHIALMLLASILVLRAAFIARRRADNWFLRHRQSAVLGVTCALSGGLTMVIFKLVKQYPHFRSPHSIIGLTALILLIFTPLLGSLAAKGNNSLRNPHKLIGRVATLLTSLAAVTGILRFLQITQRIK